MSPYEQNILDFYKIYEEKPDLFTDADRASLEILRAGFSDDDNIEKVSDAIALWCEEHPHILDVLLEMPPGDTAERGPGNRKTRLTTKETLGLLKNMVRQSKPDSEPPSSSPQTPSKT